MKRYTNRRSLLLGRVALEAQQHIVVKLSHERSVGRFVGLSVCLQSWVSAGRNLFLSEMQFKPV